MTRRKKQKAHYCTRGHEEKEKAQVSAEASDLTPSDLCEMIPAKRAQPNDLSQVSPASQMTLAT